MKNLLRPALLVMVALLAGCASTFRSDVTVFHAWPAELPDKSFAFELEKSPEGTLEYQFYQQLVSAELHRLGFTAALSAPAAALRVALDYDIQGRDVRVVQPVLVDPYWYGGAFYASPYHRHGGWHSGFYGSFYGPFYDPFWYEPPIVAYQQSDYRVYHRQLHIVITRSGDGKKLYDVTVTSEGRNGSLAAAMPYMVRSAFADFPGKSGVARQVELPIKD